MDGRGEVQDTFNVTCADTSALPGIFKQGYIMVHRREVPGIIVLLDYKGNVLWHHQAKKEGFKVVNFTKDRTFLCLLGTNEYETGYGGAVLELSLTGDTLLYLKKGQNDFQQTIHHEIIPNKKNELVTLCVEDRIMDLRSRGGLAKDTVRGDGILVLDRQARKKWKWTVFDALDPLKDTAIAKSKKDWMHANSVSFDKDGNYLVSFYNNSQIWKIDAVTGKVIWKLGKGGDFAMPAGVVFGQAHAVHVNERGWLQFFDNGTNNKLSRSLSLVLNERVKKAQLINATWLPPHLFSDRMGSSYLVGDNTLLLCASKHKTIALTNFNGDILWQLRSSGIVSYRAQFISKEKLAPYINL
ncbi:MAG: aryl-sulfate sulfotransferase [Flavisolibacter sp.]|nr:aryl-sulfate sulfotransferase [Flavisolibacter sp.]